MKDNIFKQFELYLVGNETCDENLEVINALHTAKPQTTYATKDIVNPFDELAAEFSSADKLTKKWQSFSEILS